MEQQAIVVSGPLGSGAITVAREIARRIGGTHRKCHWREFVAPIQPRALRDKASTLIVEDFPDSEQARDMAAQRLASFDQQIIFIARSVDALADHRRFAVVHVERKAPAAPKKPVRHTPQCHLHLAGLASAFELTMRFIAWAGAMHEEPTVQQIRERWEVSRATAFRWRQAWRDAKGAVTA